MDLSKISTKFKRSRSSEHKRKRSKYGSAKDKKKKHVSKRRSSPSSDSSSSSSSSYQLKYHSKRKLKSYKRTRTRSTSSSSSSDCTIKKRKKHHKKHRKVSKSKNSERKYKKTVSNTLIGVVGTSLQGVQEISGPDIGPSIQDASKSMAPITKEEWEKSQSVVRRVHDPETGRNRLIKGDGEIIEEIVSKERHKEINKAATFNDGEYFKKTAGLL